MSIEVEAYFEYVKEKEVLKRLIKRWINIMEFEMREF